MGHRPYPPTHHQDWCKFLHFTHSFILDFLCLITGIRHTSYGLPQRTVGCRSGRRSQGLFLPLTPTQVYLIQIVGWGQKNETAVDPFPGEKFVHRP